ncbi:MAG: hypothetical protein AAGH64_01135 [Planctomycetota bacterium]
MRTHTLDTVELSVAATRGTEAPHAPSAPHATRLSTLLSRITDTPRAQRLREWRRILDTIAPGDVHRARRTPGLTALERFALTEAWR